MESWIAAAILLLGIVGVFYSARKMLRQKHANGNARTAAIACVISSVIVVLTIGYLLCTALLLYGID